MVSLAEFMDLVISVQTFDLVCSPGCPHREYSAMFPGDLIQHRLGDFQKRIYDLWIELRT